MSFRGQPMQLPVVDIVEVGAGGGSLAWCDDGGGLHVGPVSAGADPGPACYGRGGAQPAVTDADLVLGRLNGARFLGGSMTLDRALAETAVREDRRPAQARHGRGGARDHHDCGRRDVARGARGLGQPRHRSARHHADRVRRRRAAARGRDRARDSRSRSVVIPKLPGNFSALGMLMAQWRQDFVRTLIGQLGEIEAGRRGARLRRVARRRRAGAGARSTRRAAASTSPPTCAIAGRSIPLRFPCSAPRT